MSLIIVEECLFCRFCYLLDSPKMEERVWWIYMVLEGGPGGPPQGGLFEGFQDLEVAANGLCAWMVRA